VRTSRRDLLVLLVAGVSNSLAARSVVWLSEMRGDHGRLLFCISFLFFLIPVGHAPGVGVSWDRLGFYLLRIIASECSDKLAFFGSASHFRLV
jgi:hypothetical protein